MVGSRGSDAGTGPGHAAPPRKGLQRPPSGEFPPPPGPAWGLSGAVARASGGSRPAGVQRDPPSQPQTCRVMLQSGSRGWFTGWVPGG